jgi:hypothetical protein
MTKCRGCHSAYERARRTKIELQQNVSELQKFTTRIAKSRSDRKIRNLVDLMVSRLGGPNKFREVWQAEVDRVRTQKPRTLYALKFCECVVREHQSCALREFVH